VPAGITVAVTDHAVERFRQRVAARRGDVDARPEIAARVSRAWAAGRVSAEPPDRRASASGPRGAVYVADLIDRDVVFVCRHDERAGELIVITVWERERLGAARVPRRFTDALRRGRGGRPAGDGGLDSDG
jgi:hypothetical protein